ncbi:MAG: DUF6531 domain-containing protein [[Clostridium] symbiosum]
MKIIYQSIWIELPYPVVTIVDFRSSESLNAHAEIALEAVIEEEKAAECLNQNAENQTIKAGVMENGREVPAFFMGYLSELDIYYEKGQAMLMLTAVSYTRKWDVSRLSRSFQNLDFTYGDIINSVLSGYPGAEWMGKADTERRISGLILQYEETDWEFLCRLSTHFSTFIMTDPSTEGGRIYFGIPEIDEGECVEEDDYEIAQNIAGYQDNVYNAGLDGLSQDNLQWRIISRKRWKMGERVTWNQVPCLVVSVQLQAYNSDILYAYTLGRADGLYSQSYGNRSIIGLSLPALIKERSGNQLRVQFKLDPGYQPGNNVYYTYAIETVSWYCIPEIGSMVHIYFPTWDESYAIAVHAMRLGSAQAGRKKAVGDKSFTTCDGKEMLFTESGITFLSDAGMASTLSLERSGTLKLEGKNIAIGADLSSKIGEATVVVGEDEKTVTAKIITIKSETGQVTLGILEDYEAEEPKLKEETGIALFQDGNILIKAEKKAYYIGEQKDPPLITYSDEDLKAQDAAQREEHNAEVMEVRANEAKGKISFGAAIAVAGVVITGAALAVATGVTGGAAAPLWVPYAAAASATLGTVAVVEGTSNVAEGAQDLSKMHTGDFSQSANPVLKYMFNNDRDAYYQSMVGNIMMATSLLLLTAPGAGKAASMTVKQFLKQALVNTGKQAALNAGLGMGQAYLLDAADGYIDMSLEDYMKIGARSAAITAVGGALMMPVGAAANFYRPLNNLITGSPWGALGFIGVETALDVGTDAFARWLNGESFDMGDFWMSLGTHLASNAIFSIDPVDVATGGMFLAETDMAFNDIGDGVFKVQRFYNSVIPYYGTAGRKWRFSFESRIIFHDEKQKADVFCVDGHTESFLLTEEGYVNKKGGSRAYHLEAEEGEGFLLLESQGRKVYHYGLQGQLLSVTDRIGNRMEIRYNGILAEKIITFSGHEIGIAYEDGRVAELRDETGRLVQYKYRECCMTDVRHVDKGITTYAYDRNANITRVVDPKGNSYITNEYDSEGRVTVQRYPDGSRSTVEYRPHKRESLVCIEAFDRTERYCYNEDGLITHSYFDDGTCIEYGYDQWQNRIYEKDRLGNVTKRNYDVNGKLLYEEKPCGQWEKYEYDPDGNLVHKQSAAGGESLLCYDEKGSLVSEAVKMQESLWSRTTYESDRYGRILKKTDGEGNETVYEYILDGPVLENPMRVVDPMGQEVRYEYDRAGRRTAVITAYGRAEFAYNSLDLVTYVRDGEGNETRRFYDKAGRLKFMVPPNLAETGEGWSYKYDFFNRLIEVRDPLGTVKRTERDLAGKILREIHPEAYAKDREQGEGIRHEYDRDRYRLRTIYPDGSTERRFYDANGNLIKRVEPVDYSLERDDGPGETYEYDGLGRLTCMKDPSGNVSRRIKYDLAGNAVEEIDALGNTTYSSYDLLGNLIQKQEPVEKRDGAVLYRVTRYEYDRNSNRTAEHQGIEQVALGGEPGRWGHLRYTYDKLNRLIKVEDGSGARAEYQYDCLNQKTCESFQINKDTRKVIRYCYDRAGRLTEKKEELENRFLQPGKKAGSVWSITRYQYDKNGNCTQVITPKGYQKEAVYDKIDRMVGLTETDRESGIKRRLSYAYDRADNLIGRRDDSLEQPRIRSYRYDRRDNLTHYVDEEGGTARIFYDGNGRVRKLVRPEQYDSVLDDGPGTCYQYNHMGKVTAVINALGQTEQENEYDPAGNLIGSADGGKSRAEYVCNLQGKPLEIHTGSDYLREGRPAQSYTYDARGNITGVQDGNGNRTEFLLDEWGRIVEIHTPEGGVERYAYDYAGNITSTTDANGGTITYRYNSQGQVSEITDQEGNSEYFYYDEEGRQETHVDRNGNVERTLYNMDNQMVYQRAEDKKGRNPVVNQYVYYPDGSLKEATGGGITYRYEYTGTGLLKSKSAPGKRLLDYAYDKNQNVIRMTDLTGKSTTYAYDLLDRLERVEDMESGEALAVYRYTPSGRKESLRLGNGVQTKYRYGEDGSLSSLVTVTQEGELLLNYDYAYDGNGNCTKKSGERYQNEYAYDNMGRLLEANYNGSKETYAYDLAGNRLKKETAEGTELYSYNAMNQLLQIGNCETHSNKNY